MPTYLILTTDTGRTIHVNPAAIAVIEGAYRGAVTIELLSGTRYDLSPASSSDVTNALKRQERAA